MKDVELVSRSEVRSPLGRVDGESRLWALVRLGQASDGRLSHHIHFHQPTDTPVNALWEGHDRRAGIQILLQEAILAEQAEKGKESRLFRIRTSQLSTPCTEELERRHQGLDEDLLPSSFHYEGPRFIILLCLLLFGDFFILLGQESVSRFETVLVSRYKIRRLSLELSRLLVYGTLSGGLVGVFFLLLRQVLPGPLAQSSGWGPAAVGMAYAWAQLLQLRLIGSFFAPKDYAVGLFILWVGWVGQLLGWLVPPGARPLLARLASLHPAAALTLGLRFALAPKWAQLNSQGFGGVPECMAWLVFDAALCAALLLIKERWRQGKGTGVTVQKTENVEWSMRPGKEKLSSDELSSLLQQEAMLSVVLPADADAGSYQGLILSALIGEERADCEAWPADSLSPMLTAQQTALLIGELGGLSQTEALVEWRRCATELSLDEDKSEYWNKGKDKTKTKNKDSDQSLGPGDRRKLDIIAACLSTTLGKCCLLHSPTSDVDAAAAEHTRAFLRARKARGEKTIVTLVDTSEETLLEGPVIELCKTENTDERRYDRDVKLYISSENARKIEEFTGTEVPSSAATRAGQLCTLDVSTQANQALHGLLSKIEESQKALSISAIGLERKLVSVRKAVESKAGGPANERSGKASRWGKLYRYLAPASKRLTSTGLYLQVAKNVAMTFRSPTLIFAKFILPLSFVALLLIYQSLRIDGPAASPQSNSKNLIFISGPPDLLDEELLKALGAAEPTSLGDPEQLSLSTGCCSSCGPSDGRNGTLGQAVSIRTRLEEFANVNSKDKSLERLYNRLHLETLDTILMVAHMILAAAKRVYSGEPLFPVPMPPCFAANASAYPSVVARGGSLKLVRLPASQSPDEWLRTVDAGDWALVGGFRLQSNDETLLWEEEPSQKLSAAEALRLAARQSGVGDEWVSAALDGWTAGRVTVYHRPGERSAMITEWHSALARLQGGQAGMEGVVEPRDFMRNDTGDAVRRYDDYFVHYFLFWSVGFAALVAPALSQEEAGNGLRHLQLANGLSCASYWLAHFLVQFAYFTGVVLTMAVIFYFSGGVFSHNPGTFTCALLAYGFLGVTASFVVNAATGVQAPIWAWIVLLPIVEVVGSETSERGLALVRLRLLCRRNPAATIPVQLRDRTLQLPCSPDLASPLGLLQAFLYAFTTLPTRMEPVGALFMVIKLLIKDEECARWKAALPPRLRNSSSVHVMLGHLYPFSHPSHLLSSDSLGSELALWVLGGTLTLALLIVNDRYQLLARLVATMKRAKCCCSCSCCCWWRKRAKVRPLSASDLAVKRERARVAAEESATLVVKDVRGAEGSEAGLFPPVSFAVAAGQSLAVLDSEASEATELFRLLTSSFPYRRGEVRLGGAKVPGWAWAWGHFATVSYCPANNTLFPALTPRQHLRFFAKARRGGAEEEALVEELLDELMLASEADRRVSFLSEAAQRKLQLAIALVGAPEMLILEEPTRGLDPEGRRAAWAAIRRATGAGSAVLIRTTSGEEAEALGQRVGFFLGNSLRCLGSPQELRARLGGLYRLTLLLSAANGQEAVKKCVKRSLPEARLKGERSAWLRYELPVAGLKLSRLVEVVKDLGLVDWTLAPKSLGELYAEAAELLATDDEEARDKFTRFIDQKSPSLAPVEPDQSERVAPSLETQKPERSEQSDPSPKPGKGGRKKKRLGDGSEKPGQTLLTAEGQSEAVRPRLAKAVAGEKRRKPRGSLARLSAVELHEKAADITKLARHDSAWSHFGPF